MTGGRIKRVRPFIGNEPFMLTYGDGVGNVNINELLAFHKAHGKTATVTSTQPSGRFGSLDLGESSMVKGFQEKPKGDGGWINAGFFVLEPDVFDYINDDATIFEKEPMEKLALDRKLVAYKHYGFWQPMDSLRDKNQLEEIWKSGTAPWKVWG
jgi:glucose-1-phosphate cytidylyltransferase